jgi:polysaccharide export outer membrane protein
VKPRSKCLLPLIFLALAASLAAQEGAAPVLLGPQDMVRVRVAEVPELNVDSRVSNSGELNLPVIGPVPAAGLSESGLAASLQRLLETRGLKKATVTIEVLERLSRSVMLLGAVQKPGAYAIVPGARLLDVLALAGGLRDDQGGEILVLRRASTGLSDQIALRVEDLVLTGRPEANVPLVANDLVNVPPRREVSIFCLGEIRTPGAVTFKSTERITLLAVLARAGGMTDRASKKIHIRRRDDAKSEREIVVDFGRIVSGKDDDPVLRDGDLVVVKESLF